MRNQDAFRGCLIGGAAGDALGYAVEFMREGEIFRRYGPSGITEYALRDGLARISDDTQMTLFTATGLLRGTAAGADRDAARAYPEWINRSYLDWLKTQRLRVPPKTAPAASWLARVPELYSPRAPGNTCLSALERGGNGSVREPINGSKGCGGVMRVAPIGLYFNDRDVGVEDVCRVGAEAAALTHGHPLGWMPAAVLTEIIHEISQNGAELADAVRSAMNTVCILWPDSPDRRYLTGLMDKAVSLAARNGNDLDAIHELGEGWVAEETLAIAVYCALRYPGDIDRVLVAAVNHNGDSDSTGAVAGNIVGAQVGLSGIPAKYTERLELCGLIQEVADDLWLDRRADADIDAIWRTKYANVTWEGGKA